MTLTVYPEIAAGRQQLRMDMGRTKEKSVVSNRGRRSCTPVYGYFAVSLTIHYVICLRGDSLVCRFSLLVSVTGGCDLALQVDT